MMQQQNSGTITVYFGPMFSGKSTSLLNEIENYEKEGKKVLVINFAHDNRYSSDALLVTHNKKFHKAQKCYILAEVEDIYMDYDVIAIDEGQFFDDIAEYSDKFANKGKIVVVAALDATFQRKAFNNILDMVPIAEKVYKLSAKCSSCGKDASYSARKISSKQVELIGGEDIYEPLCRGCFNIKQKNTCDDDDEQSASDSNSDNFAKRRNSNSSTYSNSTDLSQKHVS